MLTDDGNSRNASVEKILQPSVLGIVSCSSSVSSVGWHDP